MRSTGWRARPAERLRKKGYFTRRRREGFHHYSPRVPAAEVVQGLLREFVEQMLAGSISPVVTHLGRARHLSDAELDELQRVGDALKAEKAEQEP